MDLTSPTIDAVEQWFDAPLQEPACRCNREQKLTVWSTVLSSCSSVQDGWACATGSSSIHRMAALLLLSIVVDAWLF